MSFDPNKQYNYEKDAQFTVTGEELEALNLVVQLQQADVEYRKFLVVQKCSEVINRIFERNKDLLTEIQSK